MTALTGLMLLCLALFGCGGKSGSSAMSERLAAFERADLVMVAQALARAEPSLSREIAAARAVWPAISHGLPASVPASLQRQIAAGRDAAKAILAPAFMTQLPGATFKPRQYLTGPGANIAGLFQSFSNLAEQGWRLIGATIESSRRQPASAAFLRANARLYIACIYDAHFDLALIGRRLASGYRSLGAGRRFGAMLTEAQVNSLAAFYSDRLRLEPHAIERLG